MLYLVTGGSGSGKSEYAENLAVSLKKENLIYIATMFPFDDESLKKIKRHKDMRKNKGFLTKECYKNLEDISICKNYTVLLDCMSNLVANEMYMENKEDKDIVLKIINGVKRLKNISHNIVIVTNEIFSDGIEYDEETEKYINNLGKINKELGQLAEHVIEVIYTIPIYHKGGEVNVEFI